MVESPKHIVNFEVFENLKKLNQEKIQKKKMIKNFDVLFNQINY